MNKLQRQQSWSEYLDAEKKNKLFVRYVFTQDFKELEEFAVSFLLVKNDEDYSEIIRYDCSIDEEVHVHKFFHNPPLKKYLQKDKSFTTLMELSEDIRKNWRPYLLHYSEKEP